MKRTHGLGNSVYFILLILLISIMLSCSRTEVRTSDNQEAGNETPSVWQMITVSGSTVNLRAGPGTQYAVLGQVLIGDTLQVTGGIEDWYRVYIPTMSLFAWIYGPLTSGAELP